METVIRAEGLRKTYGDVVAVDAVDLEVRGQEIFGILGPNGAGKTTTVEMLAGLRRPDAGRICVLGLDPQREPHALRRRVGIQLQQAALPDQLRVWEALDLFSTFYDDPPDWRPLLAQWGLEARRDAAFVSLSGGQQQRLFIALALLHDPELVILDELTSGLDPQARRGSWEVVRRIRERGKTVLLVTHFMDEAEALCDRVAIIDHGRLVAVDSPRALIAAQQAPLEIRFTRPADMSLALLDAVDGVEGVEEVGDEVRVRGNGALMAAVSGALARAGYAPPDLCSRSATLEDVFLSLTGHALRE